MDTPAEHVKADYFIARLAHRPGYAVEGMISIPEIESPTPSAIDRAPVSPLGRLDALPREVLDVVFRTLDFRSLSRLSRVSLRAKFLVESLREYRGLMEHAPQALAALSRTKTIKLHSAAAVHAALRSEECVSCAGYGAFLFLPTCERCCWECLHRNESLWVVPRSLAETCFGLSRRRVSRLPGVRTIPGAYSVGQNIVRPNRLRLVSVAAAKRLAVSIHGSEEEMARALSAARTRQSAFLHLRDVPLKPIVKDPTLLASKANAAIDGFCGMASVSFPSLRPGRPVENGLWCRGCERACDRYRFGALSAEALSSLVPPGCEPMEVLMGLERRGRSRAGFLEHIKHCIGARGLAPDLWSRGEIY